MLCTDNLIVTGKNLTEIIHCAETAGRTVATFFRRKLFYFSLCVCKKADLGKIELVLISK
jgi:hypothetical protein